jgi:GABA permease
VFLFLLNSSGAVILFVYLLIAASELVLRLKTPDDCLKIKMWGFPLLTLATIAAMVAVLAMMAFQEEARSQLILSLTSVVVVIGAYFLKKRSLSP